GQGHLQGPIACRLRAREQPGGFGAQAAAISTSWWRSSASSLPAKFLPGTSFPVRAFGACWILRERPSSSPKSTRSLPLIFWSCIAQIRALRGYIRSVSQLVSAAADWHEDWWQRPRKTLLRTAAKPCGSKCGRTIAERSACTRRPVIVASGARLGIMVAVSTPCAWKRRSARNRADVHESFTHYPDCGGDFHGGHRA